MKFDLHFDCYNYKYITDITNPLEKTSILDVFSKIDKINIYILRYHSILRKSTLSVAHIGRTNDAHNAWLGKPIGARDEIRPEYRFDRLQAATACILDSSLRDYQGILEVDS